MTMPKTTVNKNYLSEFWEDQVRFAGKSGIVQPIPVSTSVCDGANAKLRLGVRSVNQRHPFTAFGAAQSVHRW